MIKEWDDMEKLWHHIYYNEIHINPDEHPAMLTEAPFTKKCNREKIMEIMFEKFSSPSFYLAN